MNINIIYYPTSAWFADGNWFCGHPDTQTELELNAWGDSIWVTRCSECGSWYDEAFNTFEECVL